MEGGVSHKIAMQGPLFQGQGQFIPGKSKMIYADHHITFLGEMPNGVKIEPDFFLGSGQILFAKRPFMSFEHPGQVSKTVNRQPVRAHFGNRIQGLAKLHTGLQRKPIDQIEVDALISEFLGNVKGFLGLRGGLVAVDGALYCRIDVLDPKTDTPESKIKQPFELFSRRHPGVGLQSPLPLRIDFEVMLQHLGQLGQLIQTEEGRGASAKVKLREGFALPKTFGDSGHFLLKSFQVALNQFCITGDDFVASAKGAKCSAERNVKID